MAPDTSQSPSSSSFLSSASNISPLNNPSTFTSTLLPFKKKSFLFLPTFTFHTTPVQSVTSQVSGAWNPIPSRNNHTHHLASQSHIPTTRDTLKQRTRWSGDQQSVITWYEASCIKEEKRISLQLQESVD